MGITGAEVDYVDSTGSVIRDAAANSGYKFNITSIGRDDNQALAQKQSKSQNTSGLVTIALGSIFATNQANTNNFANDRSYLTFGDDNS